MLGHTVCKLPDFILKDINNLMGLFEALSVEKSGEVRAAIYDCLTKIAAWIRDNPLSESFNTTMEALLFENIEKADGACRQVAIHFADTIYPKDHIPSRYIILQVRPGYSRALCVWSLTLFSLIPNLLFPNRAWGMTRTE